MGDGVWEAMSMLEKVGSIALIVVVVVLTLPLFIMLFGTKHWPC